MNEEEKARLILDKINSVAQTNIYLQEFYIEAIKEGLKEIENPRDLAESEGGR